MTVQSTSRFRIALLETHPIQYKAPWFLELHEHPDIDLTVFFCMLPGPREQGTGFDVEFQWDVPVLDGYRYEVLENVAKDPGMGRFGGCDTPGLREAVRDGGFDAFVVNGWVVKSCIQLLLYCRRYRVPCIVRGESNVMRPRIWWKSLLHRLLIHQYSACLYIGISNREFYARNGVPDSKLFFAPYCVDNDRFTLVASEARKNREQLRADWGVDPDSICFLFSGKLTARKRPTDVLHALRYVHGDGSRKVHALVVGDGELANDCKAVAEQHDLPVTFAGFVNQSRIPEAYAATDCLVLPSDSDETWGLVVNEAMACRLPVIVSDQVGCHPDLVEQRKSGLVFPCGDIKALAGSMQSIVDDEAHMKEMGKAALAKVSNYSCDTCVRGTLDAIATVVR